jgi:hypothetical protein
VAEGLLPDLLAAFGAQQDLDLTRAEDGDTVIYTLVRPDDQPAARFFVHPGTTDEGFLALLNGEVDIALALREPNAPERLAARDQAPDDPPLTRRVRVLALDALVPIVSRDNPVTRWPWGTLRGFSRARSTIGPHSAAPTRRWPCIFWHPVWVRRRISPTVFWHDDRSATGARHRPTPQRRRTCPGRGAGRLRGRHHDPLHCSAPRGPCP